MDEPVASSWVTVGGSREEMEGGKRERFGGRKWMFCIVIQLVYPKFFFFFFYYFFLKRALTLRGATLARMDSGAPNRVMVSLRLWPV